MSESPNVRQLIDVVGYYRTAEEVEAYGYAFDRGLPELGEVVWIHSRGGFRRGIVVKVGRKNARVEYVTAGGMESGQKTWEALSRQNPAMRGAVAADAASRSFDYYAQEIDPATRKHDHHPADTLAHWEQVVADGREALMDAARAGAVAKAEAEISQARELGPMGYAQVTGKSGAADKIARKV